MLDLTNFDDILLDGLDFCKLAYQLLENIRSTDGGISRLRMRTTKLERKLIQEILPLAKYIQLHYRAGRYISVKWKDGSQQYDAEVLERGSYIDQGFFPRVSFLEVTCAMHPNNYLSRELVNNEGFAFGVSGIKRNKDKSITSDPVVHSNQDFVESFSKIIISCILEKSAKFYPINTTLIVSCYLDTIYTIDDWTYLRDLVLRHSPESNFSEIFVYDTTTEYSFSYQPTK